MHAAITCKFVSPRGAASDLEQVVAHDDFSVKARLRRVNPHAFGDLRVVGRHQVRKHEGSRQPPPLRFDCD